MKKKKQQYKYMVVINWSDEDGAYVAEVPELPGCATHGKTFESAAKYVGEAIEAWLEGAKESGHPIPEPLSLKKCSGKFITRVDPSLHKALMMKAKAKGKSMNALVEDALKQVLTH